LQALYPLSSTLNIIRTLDPSLTPLPNATSFGGASTAFAQLFYDGVEQFYCQANSCTQKLNNTAADWQCSNLQCTCRTGTTLCGGVPDKNLTSAINRLTGTLGIECGEVDSSTNSATCHFKQTTLQTLFGPAGLALNGCTFGECVRQNIIDSGGGNTTTNDTQSSKLSGGVIAGLAVVGGLLTLALLLLVLGLRAQRAARKSGGKLEKSKASIEWTDLSYNIPAKNALFGMSKGDGSNINNDKVILDSVSGKVFPGQMMAILGPSGTQGF